MPGARCAVAGGRSGKHMTPRSNPRVSQMLAQFVFFCSVLSVAFGMWVLTGWILHIQIVKSILPGQVAVKANAAVCFILVGFALWVLRKEPPAGGVGWRLAGTIAASLASAVGLLSLLEALWAWNLGIDQLLFTAGPEDIPGSLRPGLMSPITGFSFLALGPALLLLDAKTRLGHWSRHLLSCGVAIASMFGILDFVLDPNTTHTYISPITACALFLFSFGLLFARTQSGLGALVASVSVGGTLTRRLVPAVVVAPLLIGWLRWRGELAGIVSAWTGLTIMTVFSIVLLASLTAWTGLLVDRSYWERRQGEETVARLASIVTSSNDGIIGKTLDGVVTSWNRGAEAIYGYPAPEIIGQSISIVIPPDRRDEFATILERVQQGQRVNHYETMRVRKDGRLIHVSLSVSPVLDESGNIVGATTIARDITERKRAEEELRRASLYARSLIEASLDPLVTINKDGRIMDVNQATERATGVERKALIGSDFSEYFTDPEKARQGYQQVFAKESVRDYPLAIRHISGSVMHVLYNASVFKNESGQIEGVFAAARDVTERKHAHESVTRSEMRYRSLVTATAQIVWSTNLLGEVVDDMPTWRAYTGMTLEQIQGSGWIDSLHPEDRKRTAEIWSEAVRKRSFYDTEYRVRRYDGEYRLFAARGVPLQEDDGSIREWIGACTDITERKRAEEQVRKASLYTRSLIEASLDPLVTIRKDGTIADVNRATESVTGVPRARLIGSYFFDYFSEPDKARRAYERVFADGTVRDYPLAIRAASGALTEVLYNAALFTNETGEVEGIFAAARDVTRMKAAEQEIRRLNDELEQRVLQRTAELEAANKELEAFTYSVSHDLRAPLRHISGFSKILTEEYGSSLAPEAQHHLQRIQEGTRRMGQLVDDLLNLGRVGRHEVRLQVTGLNSVVHEVVAELTAECEGRQVEWKIGSLPFVECDPALMKQVFQNLLSNALKFTRPRSNAIIEVGQKDQDGTPVVFVRDNGVGFNIKYADKLFGVFQRLHRPEDFEGTGVGLATVQRIIQKHGGRIWAEAELDKGATFYFTLGVSENSEIKTKAAMVGDPA
jgi:PAS domain S-box-containing protein